MNENLASPRDDRQLSREVTRLMENSNRLGRELEVQNNTVRTILDDVRTLKSSSPGGRIIESDLHLFSGRLEEGTFNTWYELFDLVARAQGWDNDTRARKLPAYLRERALETYRELPDAVKTNFVALVSALR